MAKSQQMLLKDSAGKKAGTAMLQMCLHLTPFDVAAGAKVDKWCISVGNRQHDDML